MVKINVECFAESELTEKLGRLAQKTDFYGECEMCHFPLSLHRGPCTRIKKIEPGEMNEIWSQFGVKMKPIFCWQ